MTEPLRVDVPGLRALGGEVASNGEDLGRDVAAVADGLAPPGCPAGWGTTAALSAAGQGWCEFLRGLSGRTTQAGRSLVTAAGNYEASDQRASRRNQGRAVYR